MTYGWQTKSWRNSTEHRQQKAENREFTERYQRGEVKVAPSAIPLSCNCRSFELPHDPERHKELFSDYDWRTPEERRGMELFAERIR